MKKLLVGLGALLVLIAAAVLLAPRLVPVDALQARLAAAVKAATGRDLGVAGGVHLAVFPQLAVQADDVTLANVAGGQAADLLRVKSLSVALRLRPLLHGSIEVARFVLDTPVIALERDAQGRGNWELGAGPPAATASAFAGFALDDIRLVDGTISYLDRRTGASWQAGGLNVTLALPGPGRPFTADGKASLNGEPMTVSVRAADPFGLAGGGQSDVSIKLVSVPATMAFDGHAGGETLNGTVDVAVPSLRALMARAGRTMAGTAPGALAFKATLAGSGGKLSFDNLVATLDGMTARGAAALDVTGARPFVKLKLVTDRIDLNPYLSPAPAAGGPPAAAGWSDAPIDVSGLRLADADVDLTSGPISAGTVKLDRLAGTAHVKDGKLAASITDIGLYGGKGSFTLAVDAAGTVPAFDLRGGFTQLQLGPLLTVVAGVDRLTGAGSVDLAVSATGGSERAIIGALGGSGKLAIANGRIAGVDLVGVARSASRVLGGGGIGDFTDIAALNGSFTINKGVLRNTDLAIRSGPVSIAGAGTVDLMVRRIDYTLRPQLPGGVSVPLRVSGPWDSVAVVPDVAGLVADPGQALGDLRKLAPGAVPGNLLKGILGR